MSVKLDKGSSFKINSPTNNPYQLEFTVTVDSIFRVLDDHDFSDSSNAGIIYEFTVEARIIDGAILWDNHQSLAVEIRINGVSSGWDDNYIFKRYNAWTNSSSNSIKVSVLLDDITKLETAPFQFTVHRIKTVNGEDSINTDASATAGTADTGTNYTIFKPKWPYCVNIDNTWKPCRFRLNSGSSWNTNIYLRPNVALNSTSNQWLDYCDM